MEQESYLCIKLIPGDGCVTFISQSDAIITAIGNIRYRLFLTHEAAHTGYYKVWVRFQSARLSSDYWYNYAAIEMLHYTIQDYIYKGRRNNKFIEAIIMKFTDENCVQPMSMRPDDPMIKTFRNKPGIKKWLMDYSDEFKPVNKNKDIRDDFQ